MSAFYLNSRYKVITVNLLVLFLNIWFWVSHQPQGQDCFQRGKSANFYICSFRCRLLSERIWPDPRTNTSLKMWTFPTFWEERLLKKDPLDCCDHVTATVSQWREFAEGSVWLNTAAAGNSLHICRLRLLGRVQEWGKESHNFWLSLRRVLRKELFCLLRHHVKLVSVDGCLSALGKTESWESHVFRTEVYDHLMNTFLPIIPLLSSSDPFFP